MAHKRVFAVVELLEAILVHLGLKDILVVHRVSKGWQAAVKRSLMLQRALCYAPSKDLLVRIGHHRNKDESAPMGEQQDGTGLQVALSTWCLQRWSTYHSAKEFVTDSVDSCTCRVNPLLTTLFHEEIFSLPGFTLVTRPHIQRLLACSKPSWDKMYLTQPPATRILLDRFYFDNENSTKTGNERAFSNHHDFVVPMTNEEGITIGDFIRELAEDEGIRHDRDLAFAWAI